MKDEYSVLWKNGELQACWAASKAEALKIARAYKREYHIEYNYPIKALTYAEATEIIRTRLLSEVEK